MGSNNSLYLSDEDKARWKALGVSGGVVFRAGLDALERSAPIVRRSVADAAAVRAARASIEAGEPLIPWEQIKADACPHRLSPGAFCKECGCVKT